MKHPVITNIHGINQVFTPLLAVSVLIDHDNARSASARHKEMKFQIHLLR